MKQKKGSINTKKNLYRNRKKKIKIAQKREKINKGNVLKLAEHGRHFKLRHQTK